MRHWVVDTQVVSLANRSVRRHVSNDQKNRWAVLRNIANREVTPLWSKQLFQQYVTQLKATQRSDIVRVFLDALTKYGIENHRGLTHSEIAAYKGCRVPRHDDLLLRTAKGVSDAVVVAEDGAVLGSASCVRRRLGIEILPPVDALAKWGFGHFA